MKPNDKLNAIRDRFAFTHAPNEPYTTEFNDKQFQSQRDFKAGWNAALTELSKAEADRCRDLVETLKFYADKNNWGESKTDMREWYLVESTDRGAKAREALAKYGCDK